MIAQRVHAGWVDLYVDAPEAEEVILIEDSIIGEPHMMHRGPDGRWICRLRMPDGVYRFRYGVDGRWMQECLVVGMPDESFLLS